MTVAQSPGSLTRLNTWLGALRMHPPLHRRPLSENRPTERIAILDGFRALAILSVLAFHYMFRWAAPYDPDAHLPVSIRLLPVEYGWMGVQFFFVISGFVIIMTLDRCHSIGDFMIRRFARIWPALITGATLTALVMLAIGPPEWRVTRYDYFASVSLLDPWILSKILHHPDIHWVDGAYWSLWYEVRFYVIAAAVYLLGRRNFVHTWVALQATFPVALQVLRYFRQSEIADDLEFWLFAEALPYFTLGICIYALYCNHLARNVALIGAALGGALILRNAWIGAAPFQGGGPVGVYVGANLVIFVLFALFLVDHPLLRPFWSRPMVTLGQASYSLYLIHQMIGVALISKCIQFGIPYFVALPLVSSFMIFAALALFRLVELPAKALILSRSREALVRFERAVPWIRFA